MQLMRVVVVLAVLLCATPAFALEFQAFTRATEPHYPTLATNLAGLISGVVVFEYQAGMLKIGATSWSGVDTVAVQIAVTNAVANLVAVRAKADKAALGDVNQCVRRAFFEVLLDEVNTVRANIAAASLTPRTLVQANAALDAKIDALGCAP